MQKAKKVLVLLLAVCFTLASLLTGCGGEKAGTDTTTAVQTTQGETKATEEPKPQLADYEIVWYQVDNPQKDLDLVFEELTKYTKEKINASIKCNIIGWGDYNAKMPTLIAAGEKIDMAFTASWALNYVEQARKGAFLPINDLLDKAGKEILEVVDPVFFKATMVDGKNYAVPTQKEVAEQWVLSTYQEWLDETGFDPSTVKSYKDIEPYLKLMKEKHPDFLAMGVTAGFNLSSMLGFESVLGDAAALYHDNRTGFKVVNRFDTPEYKEFVELMRKWYQAGYIRKDAGTVQNNDDYKEKVAVGAWSYQPGAEKWIDGSDKHVVVPMPVMKQVITNGSAAGSMMAIPNTSKDPERAMMFINLLNTDKYVRNLVGYGIEGTHYVKIDDAHVDFPEGKDAGTVGYWRANFALQNVFNLYLRKGESADKWQKFEEWNKAAAQSQILGFIGDSAPVQNEIAACANVITQYTPLLGVGAIDPATKYPEFLQKLKEAGVEKVIAEAQKQIDAWKATQK